MLRHAACDALITTGNSCERKALRSFVKNGETIVGDRYYGPEYGFLGELKDLVAILRDLHLQRTATGNHRGELPLTNADRAAGVTWQGMVKLGTKRDGLRGA